MVLDSKDRFKPGSKMRKKSLEVNQRTDTPPNDDESPIRSANLAVVTGSVVSDPNVVENMDYDQSEREEITVILPVTSLRSVQRPQTGQKRPARDEDDSPDSGPTKSVLTEEKRIRKFICRYCNKAFSLMNVLKVHERIHTGEKPYICDICDKAFNQSGSLNRHKNTHLKRSSDNRSYSCRYCPRQFLHSSQLQDHEASEHGASAKVATTPPMLDSSVPNLYDSKSRSTGFCEMNAVSSPMRIRGFTGVDSGLPLTDEMPTSMPNLNAVTNMFTKFDTNPIGYPPLSVALSLFNSQTDTYSVSNTENSTLKVSDKQHPTMNRYSDNRTEDHSPDTCVPRTIEFGKHMIQQISLPFGSHCPDALSNVKSSNPLGSPANNQTRPKEISNPMEELLLNALQNTNKLTFPPLPTPYIPITSTSPDPVLSQDPLTATLFPGAAAAATLAALGQLLFPNSSSNTNPLSNPSLLANALANQEILADPKFLVQQRLLSSNTVNFENAPFIQLIKSVTGLNSPFECKAPLLKNTACNSGQETQLGPHEEQGLNLAVGDKNRNQAPNGKATRPLNLPVLSQLPLSHMDVHSGAWMDAQNIPDKSVLSADQLTQLSHKNGDKTDDATDTVKKIVRKPDQSAVMRSCLQETDTHSLNSFSPRNLSIVMNTYGFEGDTFSDPDGSSTTGSNPGSSIKKSYTDCSPTSHRLRQCNVCDKTFNCSSALHIHYRKHSGERPFVCKHCGNAFSQNGTLKRHLQTCKTALFGDDQHSELEKNNCRTSGPNHLNQSPEATECEVPAQTDLPVIHGQPSKLVDPKPSNDEDYSVQPMFNKAPAAENPVIRQTSKYSPSKFVSRSSQTHTSELTNPVVCSESEKLHTTKNTEEHIQESHPLNELQDGDGSVTSIGSMNADDLLRATHKDQKTLLRLLEYLKSTEFLHECVKCQTYFREIKMLHHHKRMMHSEDYCLECTPSVEDQENTALLRGQFSQRGQTEPHRFVSEQIYENEEHTDQSKESFKKSPILNVNTCGSSEEGNKVESELFGCGNRDSPVPQVVLSLNGKDQSVLNGHNLSNGELINVDSDLLVQPSETDRKDSQSTLTDSLSQGRCGPNNKHSLEALKEMNGILTKI